MPAVLRSSAFARVVMFLAMVLVVTVLQPVSWAAAAWPVSGSAVQLIPSPPVKDEPSFGSVGIFV
ncbi:MAG: hypothetical protein EPN91_08945 [Salinibacterium sp.]|nr:MAG: hypothetical protein EPN91_08945 [Salinibacterium sp.]